MRALLLLLASPGWCWNGHRAVTHAALSDAGWNALIPYESFDAYLGAVGKTRQAFLADLQLNPKSPIAPEAGEMPGASLSASQILEFYADEPDEAMDQDIFDSYPGAWKDDYLYMGGKLPGGADRLWRHGYWPGGFFKAGDDGKPVLESRPIGEAPARAKLFYELSLSAYRSGHPYWGTRFLAWALHYVQDAGEPFHSVQIPSMRLIVEKADGGVDLEGTMRQIIFYHLGHEALAKSLLAGGAAGRLSGALRDGRPPAATTPDGLVKEVAASSSQRSKEAVKTCADLFPDAGDPDKLDPRIFWTKAYQDQLAANEQARPEKLEAFEALLAGLFSETGAATRALVKMAEKDLGPSAASAPAPDSGR